jgi:hypothetical protein
MFSRSRVLPAVLLIIVFSHLTQVEAQDVQCGIVFLSEGKLYDVRLNVYAQEDGVFTPKSILQVLGGGILPGKELAPDRKRLYLAWLEDLTFV